MYGLYCAAMFRKERQVPIIVYHSVDESGSCISITASRFRRHMVLIKEGGYRTITVRELVDMLLAGKKAPDNTVVLTFDDGFESNYRVAWPVLRELGLTATIFLTTDYISGKCTWDKEDDIPDLPLLSWEMIKEMSGSGMDFQSHTATHPHLPLLSESQIREEVKKSRMTIEDRLNKKCDILCYPYAEFDRRVVGILQDEGYAAALAGQPDHEDIYSVKRIGSGHLNTDISFKTALTGIFPAYYSLKKAIKK